MSGRARPVEFVTSVESVIKNSDPMRASNASQKFVPLMHRILIFMLAFSALPFAASSAERLPNVIIVFTDDQGYGDLGIFGAKGYTTPNIDRLAREGTKFTNFHVAQAVCSASRAALLTGCYSNRVGIHGALGPTASHGINGEETTFAEMMKSRGYATGMAGKL